MLPAPAIRRALRWLVSIPWLLAAAGHAQAPPVAPPPPVAAADDPALPAPPLIAVQEVVVTATRTERDVLEVPGNVTVLDGLAIEASGARDLVDLLRRESGLFVVRRTINPEGTSIEARGFNNGSEGGSGTLVLVDGRRVNLPDSTRPDWALFPTLDQVERVEVIRGPASARVNTWITAAWALSP